MKVRFVSTLAIGLALCAAAFAQDVPVQPSTQSPPPAVGQGQRGGGRGGWGGGGGGGMMGRGLMGTVTAVAADSYTVKTEAGETYTVHFSVNTRIMKQPPGGRGQGGGGGAERGQGGEGMGRSQGMDANPPQAIKPTEIKVGDAIAAMGEIDTGAKSVGAVTILQIDPERARQMREIQANYGKTWLMGKVTAIDGIKVTLMGSVDNVAHSFVADENTTFRQRRDPITLADIQVGSNVRVEGAVKDGIFVAATVNAMTPQGPPPTVPRDPPGPTQ